MVKLCKRKSENDIIKVFGVDQNISIQKKKIKLKQQIDG